MRPIKGLSARQSLGVAAGLLAALAVVAVFAFRDDILRASIDPKAPYQAYRPPPAPDWSLPTGWALIPADPNRPAPTDGPADVFFIHSTTYDSAKQWNAPIGDEHAQATLQRVVLPNYAGPFARSGRVFAPQYRQATLFSTMTFRDDAREARAFAYQDVQSAFRLFLQRWNHGRPLVIVGVREGALIAARLLREEIAPDPALRARLAAAYLIDQPIPARAFAADSAMPACSAPGQPRCVLGWTQVVGGESLERRVDRAAYWADDGDLHALKGEPLLCVNPILGARTDAPSGKRLNRGAANATGLEWGARPAFLSREVSARCERGLLRVSAPTSGALKPSGSWEDRRKAPGFNLFWADLEADAEARVTALAGMAGAGYPAGTISTVVSVRSDPLHAVPGG